MSSEQDHDQDLASSQQHGFGADKKQLTPRQGQDSSLDAPTTKKEPVQYSPRSHASPQRQYVNTHYEDYSPSKGIYEYMTSQLKVSEQRNDEKDRQLASYKGQLATTQKQNQIIQRENLKLQEEVQFLQSHLRDSEETGRTTQRQLQDANLELERTHKTVLQLEENVKLLENELHKKSDESNFWQRRFKDSEVDKSNQIDQLTLEKRKAVEDQIFLREKEAKRLNGEIDRLQERLAQSHVLAEDLKALLKKTQLEKAAEELEVKKLQEALELKNKIILDNEAKHALDLRTRDALTEDKLSQLRQLHAYEKDKLKQDIAALNALLAQKSIETREERIRNHELNKNLVEKDQRLRNESLEKEIYRSKYDKAERDRSIEQELNRSLVDNLKKSHHHELIKQEAQKEALRSLAAQKEKEALESRATHVRTLSELHVTQREKQRAAQEAEYQRLKALEAEKRKHLELAIREDLHTREKDQITRKLSVEKELLASQVHALSHEASRRAVEANEWRRSYEHEKVLERSLSAEKEHLQKQVTVLNHEVVRKATEASDWKLNYLREKEAEQRLAAQNAVLNNEVARKTVEASEWKYIATSPGKRRTYY